MNLKQFYRNNSWWILVLTAMGLYILGLTFMSMSVNAPIEARQAECKEVGGTAWLHQGFSSFCADDLGNRIILPSERL